jgi:hypothetical protein
MKKIILLLTIALMYSCKKDDCQSCKEQVVVTTTYPYSHPLDQKTSENVYKLCTDEEIDNAEKQRTDTAEGSDPDFPYIKTTVVTIKKASCN